MPLSQGQKLGLVAAAGIGAYLLMSGSSKASSGGTPVTPDVDPCVDPKDCATLTTCATKAMATATKADVPKLQAMKTTAEKLGCAELAKTLGLLITTLTGTGGGGDTGGTGTIIFNPAKIKSKQTLINKAWTLARMGPGITPIPEEDVKKYNIQSDGSFGSVPAAISYQYSKSPIFQDVKTGLEVTKSPSAILVDLQNAAGITPDGKWGPQSEAAFNWGLGNGSPSSIGGEACEHEVAVGSECSACDSKKARFGEKVGGGIESPESIGPYSTMANYDDGSVKFDRTFGSQFGAGPHSGPLSTQRAFGMSARWGR